MLDARAQVLVTTVARLAATTSLEQIQEIVRTAARTLGEADGATFVLRDDGKCFYADEDAVAPLWKGQRFPLEACISGWAMLNRSAVAIPDIYLDDRIPHDAYRPTFVKSLLMTPIRSEQPIGAIGVYWAHNHEPSPGQIDLLQALADSTALAIDSLAVRELVLERTVEVDRVRRDANTDELTGVLNRRGFREAAALQLRQARERRAPIVLGFFDVDGLKAVNDRHGHGVGSQLVVMAAEAVLEAFGPVGVVARNGGDEFVALLCGCRLDNGRLRALLDDAVASVNATAPDGPTLRLSAGFTHSRGDDDRSLAELVEAADAAMYRDKRSRHEGVRTARRTAAA
jgi:diguanylate cyclase (GGDEF)-like protein